MNDKSFIGIGIGASTVKLVSVSSDLTRRQAAAEDHHGDPRGKLEEMLRSVDVREVAGIGVTGRQGAMLIAGGRIFESEAIEEALRVLGLKADAVISLGGESFVVYPVAPDGTILDYVSGNRCAAGTIEFFKQQLGRMGLSLEQAVDAGRGGTIVPLAKRCSVHCKSDCTHALNKKKCTVADIVRTLCRNIAEKAAGLARSAGMRGGTAVVIGGGAGNPTIVGDIREFLPQFSVIVPPEAAYFEALGAASIARRRSLLVPGDWSEMFGGRLDSFGFREPLRRFLESVICLPGTTGSVRPGGRYILGVDGGSTTTKAALVDFDTRRICGSHYTRTNGNPEGALKECLLELRRQVCGAAREEDIEIAGIAATGSSGEILSVMCGTPWHHNEIVAHAYGATHFCPDVDTIFEIGGQDSKFTSLRRMVPVDFNMNESCSAGTGSFIEETAKNDLGVPMEKIAEMALKSDRPPRFSDQCAAFANTDTRKAFQEGATREDNLAGLTYAIVENYMNKVAGKRKIGDRVLFQGGTSKNMAIACAFAAKTGKTITVPPHSELMGCFGIALWLREKMMAEGIENAGRSISELLDRNVTSAGEFTCKGCENFCRVQNLAIGGKRYPFGGRCSKWENARKNREIDAESLDLVALRNRMLFEEYGVPPDPGTNGGKPAIGLQAVFSVMSFYPLYSRFFHELGYAIRLSDRVDPAGVQRCQSARCYPYEIAHGTMQDLIGRGVRNVFAPHVIGMPGDGDGADSVSCPIAQALPYYLRAAFGVEEARILAPALDMTGGLAACEGQFVRLGAELGHGADEARRAFRAACLKQQEFERACKEEGRKALALIEKEDRIGIVLVGRPYNAFMKTANMGLPRKFASAGARILPCDFLPYEREECEKTMYWKHGRTILKSLKYVTRHPRLFAAFVSNFGCGPDSFIQHFADRTMGRKPYLYLELDSHTADAGISTRVAAFLDIVSGYRKEGRAEGRAGEIGPAEMVMKGRRAFVRSSAGDLVPITDRRVTVLLPSMGRHNTEALAASMRRAGLNAVALPPADDHVLALGREYTSGKECLPALLTIGSLVGYYRERFKRERKDEIMLFFMPTAGGPCRFGQYNVYMRMLVESLGMRDVAIFSLSAEDGYGGMGPAFFATAWLGVAVSSVMNDIRALLVAAARDRKAALEEFERQWDEVVSALARGFAATWRALRRAAAALSALQLKCKPGSVPKVLLTGEIFVRCDDLSCRGIDDHYAQEGIMLKRSDPVEWIYYTDWNRLNRLSDGHGYPRRFLGLGHFVRRLVMASLKGDAASREFVGARLKLLFEQTVERLVRLALRRSGLIVTRQHNVDHIVREGADFLRPALEGEAILSAGAARKLMRDDGGEGYCGVVLIGPFNCMPTGVAESLFKPYARREGIPYLTLETDGGPVPPNLQSQIEVHLLRSKRYAEAARQ